MNVMNTVTILLVVILVTVLDLAIDFTVMETLVKVSCSVYRYTCLQAIKVITTMQISMSVLKTQMVVLRLAQIQMEVTLASVMLAMT